MKEERVVPVRRQTYKKFISNQASFGIWKTGTSVCKYCNKGRRRSHGVLVCGCALQQLIQSKNTLCLFANSFTAFVDRIAFTWYWKSSETKHKTVRPCVNQVKSVLVPLGPRNHQCKYLCLDFRSTTKPNFRLCGFIAREIEFLALVVIFGWGAIPLLEASGKKNMPKIRIFPTFFC